MSDPDLAAQVAELAAEVARLQRGLNSVARVLEVLTGPLPSPEVVLEVVQGSRTGRPTGRRGMMYSVRKTP